MRMLLFVVQNKLARIEAIVYFERSRKAIFHINFSEGKIFTHAVRHTERRDGMAERRTILPAYKNVSPMNRGHPSSV